MEVGEDFGDQISLESLKVGDVTPVSYRDSPSVDRNLTPCNYHTLPRVSIWSKNLTC